MRSSRPQKARAQDDEIKAHPPNPPQSDCVTITGFFKQK
jgi:hypothetical protein